MSTIRSQRSPGSETSQTLVPVEKRANYLSCSRRKNHQASLPFRESPVINVRPKKFQRLLLKQANMVTNSILWSSNGGRASCNKSRVVSQSWYVLLHFLYFDSLQSLPTLTTPVYEKLLLPFPRLFHLVLQVLKPEIEFVAHYIKPRVVL